MFCVRQKYIYHIRHPLIKNAAAEICRLSATSHRYVSYTAIHSLIGSTFWIKESLSYSHLSYKLISKIYKLDTKSHVE